MNAATYPLFCTTSHPPHYLLTVNVNLNMKLSFAYRSVNKVHILCTDKCDDICIFVCMHAMSIDAMSPPHKNTVILTINNFLSCGWAQGQGQKDWMAISSAFYSYNPRSGYVFKGASVLTAIGDFICAVGESIKVHVNVVVNNTLAGGFLVFQFKKMCSIHIH